MTLPGEIDDILGFLKRLRTPRDWLGAPALIGRLIVASGVWALSAEHDRRLTADFLAREAEVTAALKAAAEQAERDELEAQRQAARARVRMLNEMSPRDRLTLANAEADAGYHPDPDPLRWHGRPPAAGRAH